ISPDKSERDGLNRYAYVRNNPVRYNDPSGRFAQDPDDPQDQDKEKPDPVVNAADAIKTTTTVTSRTGKYLKLGVETLADVGDRIVDEPEGSTRAAGKASLDRLDKAAKVLSKADDVATGLKALAKSRQHVRAGRSYGYVAEEVGGAVGKIGGKYA